MSEELEFTGLVFGEKFCITLDDDIVEIEVDDPAEGIAISIKRADAIALAHASWSLPIVAAQRPVGEGTEHPQDRLIGMASCAKTHADVTEMAANGIRTDSLSRRAESRS